MKRAVLFLAGLCAAAVASAEIESRDVNYSIDGQNYVGVVVNDTSISAERPGVLVIPEYWGVNDYAKRRARMLAELGYVAFVGDMYGDGKVTTDSKQAGQWSGAVKGDRPLMRKRAVAALDELKKQPGVSKDNVAAIGYCFGGTTVLELARANTPVKGVVSFHGSLDAGNAPTAEKIDAPVLVLHGAADTHVPPDTVDALDKELTKAQADWHLVAYGSAAHAFTNPDAGNNPSSGVAYNEKADKRSWEAMKDFLAEVLKK